jgi:hypothetical protein
VGSDFYTVDQAANRLGKSRRSVFNYMDKGFLSKKTEGGVKGVSKLDVEQLAVDLGSDAPAMNRANWFKMNARVNRMENELLVVKRILEIRDEPLRPNEDMAKGLYKAATESLACGVWEPEEMELWAKQFEALDEVALKAISVAVQDHKAWQPFFRLCIDMMRLAWERHTAKPSLESQALHMKLDEGRKKMRGTILMWVMAGEGLLPEAFLATLESPQETVARRLGAG